ncbi:MAG: ornithine carbamoyltransferase [Deltaproteobacteria bacterium]|nr:ornithine carbamoyltransferase [Deltaproteobacteria bacterium]
MQHLTSLIPWNQDDLLGLLALSRRVKADPRAWSTALQGKSLGMIFEKSSTRTRVSFEVGMTQLGGHALFLSKSDIQLGRGETIEDTARVLSRFVDGIMARVYAQDTIERLTVATVPVINGLSDMYHPCQALADLQTVQEHRGALAGQVLTYVGDGNNVAHSLMIAGSRAGMTVRIAHPEGYAPSPEVVAACEGQPGRVELYTDPRVAVTGADAVYTDVWASMGQEAEQAERARTFAPFQVNEALFALAKPDAIFLHCLPAHRGEEVTDGVVDHPRSAVLDQAENRMHAQKALLLHLMGGVPLQAER